MAGAMKGKVLYGALFVVVLPAALVGWAHATASIIAAPSCHHRIVGVAIVLAGMALVLAGWAALWRHGGGLPMNAFPPPRLVNTGVYRIVSHPIYAGFSLAAFGTAIASGSASGLWLVAPTAALGCVALVAGYEGINLRARFGDAARLRPWLSIVPDEPTHPTLSERLAAATMTLLPWLVLYEAIARAVPPDAHDGRLGFEVSGQFGRSQSWFTRRRTSLRVWHR